MKGYKLAGMVSRAGNQIIFSDEERKRFPVASPVPIVSALETSMGFSSAAASLTQRALEMDIAWPEGRQQRNQLIARAAELSTFAAAINHACEDEFNPPTTE